MATLSLFSLCKECAGDPQITLPLPLGFARLVVFYLFTLINIGVRANIHLGGAGLQWGGGGVVAEIFRDPYSVGWQNFFRLLQ